MEKPAFDASKHGLTGVTAEQLEMMQRAPERLEWLLERLLQAAARAAELNEDGAREASFGAYRRTDVTFSFDGADPNDKPVNWTLEIQFDQTETMDAAWTSALSARLEDRPNDLETASLLSLMILPSDNEQTERAITEYDDEHITVNDKFALLYAASMIDGITIVVRSLGNMTQNVQLAEIQLNLVYPYWFTFVETHLLDKTPPAPAN